jgi:UDP-N-acetylmuramoylalanine--D-glutamate ligase
MTGLRVAVFGAGRSGQAAAEAVLAAGGVPTVFEEARADQPRVQEAARDLQAKGVAFITGWQGEFIEARCDLVVTSPGVDRRHPKLQQAVVDGLEVVSEIELAYRVSKAPIVAITGTNGKSTTTVMTWLCLKAAGVDAILCGNVYGSGYDEVPLTEAAAKSTESQILVAEVSSFQLEWVSRFHAVSAGITNIAPDHLNRYADFAEYAATKQRVFANQGAQDTAVVRLGDPVVKVPQGPNAKTFGYESDGPADAVACKDALVVEGVSMPLGSGEPAIRLIAEHDKLNACMALLLAHGALRAAGVKPVADPADGLRKFNGLSHRMEWVGERQGVVVYNNSMCTNPRAVESSSRGLEGRQHILMGGVNKDLGFEDLAAYLREAGHKVYLFGRDARQIADQLKAVGDQDKVVAATMKEAFNEAAREANAGEIIILSPGCASFDQFEDFRQRGDVFRQLAKEWLGT